MNILNYSINMDSENIFKISYYNIKINYFYSEIIKFIIFLKDISELTISLNFSL